MVLALPFLSPQDLIILAVMPVVIAGVFYLGYRFLLFLIRKASGTARQGWDAADRRQRADPLGPDEDGPDSRR